MQNCIKITYATKNRYVDIIFIIAIKKLLQNISFLLILCIVRDKVFSLFDGSVSLVVKRPVSGGFEETKCSGTDTILTAWNVQENMKRVYGFDKGTEIKTALKFLREDGLIKSEGTEKFSYIKPKPKPVKKPKAVKAVTTAKGKKTTKKGAKDKSPFSEREQGFELAYSTAVYHIVNDWYHEDDGSNDFDALGRRQTIKAGDWKVIYQPPANAECEYVRIAHVLILPPKGQTITKTMITKVKQHVDEKLISDLKNARKDCGGKWLKKYSKENTESQEFDQEFANQVLGFHDYGIKLDSTKMAKIQFRPSERGGWIPKEIATIVGEFDDEDYKNKCERIKGM